MDRAPKRAQAKALLWRWAFVEFAGGYRLADNLIREHALMFDVDDGTTRAQLRTAFADTYSFVHSTFNATEKHDGEDRQSGSKQQRAPPGLSPQYCGPPFRQPMPSARQCPPASVHAAKTSASTAIMVPPPVLEPDAEPSLSTDTLPTSVVPLPSEQAARAPRDATSAAAPKTATSMSAIRIRAA